ncbi:hypothetical protein [Streptomyces sp. NPDC001274]
MSSYPSRDRPAFDADERTQLTGWRDSRRKTRRERRAVAPPG